MAGPHTPIEVDPPERVWAYRLKHAPYWLYTSNPKTARIKSSDLRWVVVDLTPTLPADNVSSETQRMRAQIELLQDDLERREAALGRAIQQIRHYLRQYLVYAIGSDAGRETARRMPNIIRAITDGPEGGENGGTRTEGGQASESAALDTRAAPRDDREPSLYPQSGPCWCGKACRHDVRPLHRQIYDRPMGNTD